MEEVNKVKEMTMWDGQVMEGTEVTIHSPLAVSDATLGCSIAVNGVCLTVISFDKEKVDLSLLILLLLYDHHYHHYLFS